MTQEDKKKTLEIFRYFFLQVIPLVSKQTLFEGMGRGKKKEEEEEEEVSS